MVIWGGNSRIVPLTKQSLKLLEILKLVSGHKEYVFPPDHNPRKAANSQSADRALARMGFKGRLVSHGMRALASTTLNEQGFDPDVIEAALAHIDKDAIRGAYSRTEYIKRRMPMMQWWSEQIVRSAAGDPIELSANRSLRGV
jgi:integrase